MTKKELIEKGYIDQYVLGLTSEGESTEVERLANLYPEVQSLINSARHRICSNFNRNLTQPALRSSLITKRRVILWSALLISFFSVGFCLLCREHFSLQENYTQQGAQLALEKAKVIQLASLSRAAFEQSNFMHADNTERIRLKGADRFPEAEAVIFHCANTGKMMLRVVDLPRLASIEHYEIWAQDQDRDNFMIGQLKSPIRFDSLYSLSPLVHPASLEIRSVDPYMMSSLSVCRADLEK